MQQANSRMPPDVAITQSFEEKSPLMDGKMINMSAAAIDDSVMISQPDLAVSVRDGDNSVSSTINMMHNIQTAQNTTPAPDHLPAKQPGPSSVRMSEQSMQDKWNSNGSESLSQTQHSQRGTNRSKSPRGKRDKLKAEGGKRRPDHLDLVFKAISERPILDNMTREERIREKLKFFNLENESLEQSKQRIIEKVSATGTRFGPRASNMSKKKEGAGKGSMYNPFEEMMAIEAEFGSIFASQESMRLEEAKNASRWFPLFETISQKRRAENFEKMVQVAQEQKDACLQQKQLALIKQQIARGVKNVNTDMLKMTDSKDGGESDKMDVSKMIAEEHRRAQNQRMQEIVKGIKLLSEKSDYDVHHIEGIKEFIRYKYPVEPSIDETGENIYDGILSKVGSRWHGGELSDMKSRSRSRQGSPTRTFQGSKWRQDSINVQDYKQGSHRLTQRLQSRDGEMMHDQSNVLSAMTAAGRRNKTQDRYAAGQGQGGQSELVNFVGTKSVQPSIFDRLQSQRKDGAPAGQNNFDLFSKTNSRESMERVGALIARNSISNKRGSPLAAARRYPPPSPLNFLPQDDSFYTSTMQEPTSSPVARGDVRLPKSRQQVLQQMMPQPPITDAQWKEHQAIKQVMDVDALNTYAGELATEMRIYSGNRLENIRDNVHAIIKRLRQIKPKKRHVNKGKKRQQAAAVRVPSNNEDIKVDNNEAVPQESMLRGAEDTAEGANGGIVEKQEEESVPEQPEEKKQVKSDEDAPDAVEAEEICDETAPAKQQEQQVESESIADETGSPCISPAKTLVGKNSLLIEEHQIPTEPLSPAETIKEEDQVSADEDTKKSQLTPSVSQKPPTPQPETETNQEANQEDQKRVAEDENSDEDLVAPAAEHRTSTLVECDAGRASEDAEAEDKGGDDSYINERKSQMILKTVNDREFDISLIQKFNRNDYKKTKLCRESLKPVLLALEQNDLVNFDFDWTQCFKYSIFQEELQNEIVPIIMVLKKFSRTNVGNRSLRMVLARKLVNLKLQFGIMDPEEMPIVLPEEYRDAADFKPTPNNDDIADQADLLKFDGDMEGEEAGPVTHDSSQAYQDSLYRFNENNPTQMNTFAEPQVPCTTGKKDKSNPPFFTPAQNQKQQYQNMASASGSASTFYNTRQLNIVPMTTATEQAKYCGGSNDQSPTILPNRISTGSQSKRKFAPKNAAARREEGTLPKLTGALGMATNEGNGPEQMNELSMQTQKRLIKTSHMKQRSRMRVGEIDDGSQLIAQPANSSDISPTLPSAPAQQNQGAIQSTDQASGKPAVRKKRSLRRQIMAGRQQYAENDQQVETPLISNKSNNADKWPALPERNRSVVIPVSLYATAAIMPTASQTPSNYLRSGSFKQSFLQQNGVQLNSKNKKPLKSRNNKSQCASMMTKKTCKSPEGRRQAENDMVEKILARRILQRTERRQPATRTRTASSHQAMIQAMGYRSFGTTNQNRNALYDAKKMHLSTVLPENSALKTLRAKNQHNLTPAMSPTNVETTITYQKVVPQAPLAEVPSTCDGKAGVTAQVQKQPQAQQTN